MVSAAYDASATRQTLPADERTVAPGVADNVAASLIVDRPVELAGNGWTVRLGIVGRTRLSDALRDMSPTSSPARPVEPGRDTNAQFPAPHRPGQNAPDQAWRIVALAVALVVLAVLLFFLFAGPTTEQSAAPKEEASSEEDEAEEEPAPAPAPPPPAEYPRPSGRSSSGQGSDSSPPQEAVLPPLQVLSVGYSPMPALRVVALRIGGALPYFMHEGDSIGDIKILAIMSDRVQISHKGKKYEIKVGSDGEVHLPAHAR